MKTKAIRYFQTDRTLTRIVSPPLDAVKKLDEGMKGTLADYVIGSVAETAIMDGYPYTADVKPEFSGDDKKEV